MGFLGLGKPAWKHTDPDIRLAAVAEIPNERQDLLATLARSDQDARVRAACASRVGDAALLGVLLNEGDPAVKRIAGERLSGAAETWLRTKNLSECGALLDRLTDAKSQADLACHARDIAVRRAVFAKLLAQPDLSDGILATVAIQDATGEFALQVLDRVTKRGTLKSIAAKAKHEPVKAAAAKRAEQLGQDDGKPSPAQLRQARRKALEPLLERAARLAVSTDWDKTEQAWTAFDQEWRRAWADVTAEDGLQDWADRVERARRDFRARRDEAKAKVAAQEAQADALLILAASASEPLDEAAWGALPGEIRLPRQERWNAERARRQVGTAPEAAAPAAAVVLSAADEERLAALNSEAEALVGAGRDARFRFQQLHKEWSKLAGDLPPSDERKRRFNDAYAQWKNAGREAVAARAAERQRRIEAMGALVLKAEALAAATAGLADGDFAAQVATLKDLQAQWKAIGPVPAAEADAKRRRFFAALDTAWAPVAAQREAQEWERVAKAGNAEELIQQVEALAASEDFPAIANAVKKAHQDWKNLGSLPRHQGQELWLRFKAACDAQFARCQPFFAEQDAARQGNLAAKQAILAEAQALIDQPTVGLAGSPADVQARKAAGERLTALQAAWKEIGPVPRGEDGPLWTAWRGLLDRWYQGRRALWDAQRAEQMANVPKKEALIQRAEALADAAEAGQKTPGLARPAERTLIELRELNAQWKVIGHVPRDIADTLWNRWRTALDRTYATLKDHLAAEDAEREANATKKEALIAEVLEIANHENARWFADEVKAIQRKWRDVGHVPRNRMDDLNDRFRAACDRVFSDREKPSDPAAPMERRAEF